MAHIKNEEFYLYTGFTANGNECYDAYTHLAQSNINFRHLHYSDTNQQPEVLANVKTWFPDMEENLTFPFVTYAELYEFQDPAPRVAKVVVGIDNIKNTNWIELFNYRP